VNIKKRKLPEKASLQNAHDILLDVIPVGESSRISLEIGGKHPRGIRHTVTLAEKKEQLIKQWQEIVSSAMNFHKASRGKDTVALGNLSALGQQFYADSINLGRFIYSSYLSDEMHGYITSKIDEGVPLRTWISPEGEDAFIPWETMHTGDDFVCLRLPIARTVSRLARGERQHISSNGVLLVGSTDEEGSLSHIEPELQAIEQALRDSGFFKENVNLRVLYTPEATKENVISELETGRYQVLHFAGHSVHETLEPHLGYLLLDRGRRLLVDELARLSLAGKVRLVFLNSCSSGTFGNSGMNTIGLAHAFAAAGVSYVIGMAWEISDQGAMVLAREFYKQFFTSDDPLESLRVARVKTGNKFDWNDPAWAAPILYAPLAPTLPKRESVPRRAIRPPKKFTSLLDCRPRILQIWREFSKMGETKEVRIIAATGGGTISLVNEYIQAAENPGSIRFRMLLINPELEIFDRAAAHWREECRYYMRVYLPELNRRFRDSKWDLNFEWRTYDLFPCIHGLLLGDDYLFINWFKWVNVGNRKELRGAETPYLYFEKGDENAEYFFDLFKNWFDYAWGD